MAYHRSSARRTALVSRRGYSSVDGVWDDIKGAVTKAGGAALDFYGTSARAQGAAAALEQQNKEMAAALAARSSPTGGVSTNTLLIGGVAAAGLLVLLLRRK